MIQLQCLYCEVDNGSKTLLDPVRRHANLLCVCGVHVPIPMSMCVCARVHAHMCVCISIGIYSRV